MRLTADWSKTGRQVLWCLTMLHLVLHRTSCTLNSWRLRLFVSEGAIRCSAYEKTTAGWLSRRRHRPGVYMRLAPYDRYVILSEIFSELALEFCIVVRHDCWWCYVGLIDNALQCDPGFHCCLIPDWLKPCLTRSQNVLSLLIVFLIFESRHIDQVNAHFSFGRSAMTFRFVTLLARVCGP